MTTKKNPFAGMKDTKASRDANYVTPGHYVMRVDGVHLRENRSNQPIFIIEMTPLHVLSSETCLMNNVNTVSNKAGVPCTHLIPLEGKGKDMALPNIKAFLLAAIEGSEDADIDEETVNDVVADNQPLAGLMLEVTARSIRTKANTDFTKVVYRRGEVTDQERLDRKLITKEQFEMLHPPEPAKK